MTAGLVDSSTHAAPAPVPTPSPLRLEPASAFETVRRFLRDAGYEEKEVTQRLDIESLDRFRALRDGRPATPLADAHDRATAVSERIRAAHPGIATVVVHTEP